MRLINAVWLKELLEDHQPPCVSIYIPLHRARPPAAENAMRFRNQLDQAREIIERGYPVQVAREVIKRIESIPSDESFWTADRDGIAVFASRELVRVIDLHHPTDPTISVSDRFHVKPLIRVLQSAMPYHVLTLTQRQIHMLLGIGDVQMSPLDSSNLPQSPDVVSKMRMNHEVSSVVDLHTAQTQFPDEGTGPAPVLLETFMRAVDKAVWESFSRDTRLPLILCAVEHYHPLFHAISKNPCLLDDGIRHDPQHMNLERIRKEAWAIMAPRFREQVDKLTDQFRAAKAHQQGSDELVPVVEAAAVGRVGTLLVDSSRQVPGRLHRASGQIEAADIRNPNSGDLLEDLAEMVLRADGEVMVLPPEMMPNDTGLAAIYRY